MQVGDECASEVEAELEKSLDNLLSSSRYASRATTYNPSASRYQHYTDDASTPLWPDFTSPVACDLGSSAMKTKVQVKEICTCC